MSVATIPASPLTITCDETNCREATSHEDTCRCQCGGEGHGRATRIKRATGADAYRARPDVEANGFTHAMLAAISDEEF